MSNMTKPMIEVFDTTLRDGLQVEGVSASVEDKLRIAEQLDYLGVHYIEGGWPGANPKDIEFFARAATELKFTTSTLVPLVQHVAPRARLTTTPPCVISSMPTPVPCASLPRVGTITSSTRCRQPSKKASP